MQLSARHNSCANVERRCELASQRYCLILFFYLILTLTMTYHAPKCMCIKLHHHQEHDMSGLPCRQRSLPGCGFGVVVDIVHSPMWQHPLFPAAAREMHCISLHNLVSKDKKHYFTIHLITANSTSRDQLYLESTEGIPHYTQAQRNINASPEKTSAL